jgi:hypothetical protein
LHGILEGRKEPIDIPRGSHSLWYASLLLLLLLLLLLFLLFLLLLLLVVVFAVVGVVVVVVAVVFVCFLFLLLLLLLRLVSRYFSFVIESVFHILGGSLQSGEVELMLHRRVLTDDSKGPLDLDDTDRYVRRHSD